MAYYLTDQRCKKCGHKLQVTKLEQKLYCPKCYEYRDNELK